MHEQAIGYQVKLVAQPFDEHAIMAYPLIYLIELSVYPLEAPIQPGNEPIESSIEILYKLLIHTVSAAV